jgi:SAM-dependent methyltransferase
MGVTDRLTFLQGDAENLPFPDCSFDVVVSSHVLEHLPDFDKGLSEIRRVMRHQAIISLPTCLNPCSWCLLGGDVYWKLTKRSLYGMPLGLLRVVAAWLGGKEGVNEGYAGQDIPHVWLFPWVMRSRIELAGFQIERFEAGPLVIPWVGQYVPLLRRVQPKIDRFRAHSLLRELGYGSTVVCQRGRA